MSGRLTEAQVRALEMAAPRYIRWAGKAPQKLRGVSAAGLIELSPENETTFKTVEALEDRGLLRHGFMPNGDVAWVVTDAGRAALAAAKEGR